MRSRGFSTLIGLQVVFAVAYVIAWTPPVHAQNLQLTKQPPKKSVLDRLNPIKKTINTKRFFNFDGEIVNLGHGNEAEQKTAKKVEEKNKAEKKEKAAQSAKERLNLRFWSDKPEDIEIKSPDENPLPRVNPSAPGPAIGLIDAHRKGDRALAARYGDQYVRLIQNYFFEVRDIAQIIGKALIRQGAIDEDQWVGVEQYMTYIFAQSRNEHNELLKPTHDVAMRQIKPDKRHQAEVFYFFTRACSWCRYMAPDVERLWRVAKADPRVKMTALNIGELPEDWLREYRDYTGLSVPIFDGTDMAKAMNIAFVPALVIVAPNRKQAYVKTGQQSFVRMYEFLRKVQGLPFEVNPEIKELMTKPIGQAEQLLVKGKVKSLRVAGKKGAKTRRVVLSTRPSTKPGSHRF